MARAARGPRPAPVARGGQRRREELIAVACRVFAQKGFDGASLQDIADEFGVLKGSLFHYIQSKDELLYEIIRGVYSGAEEEVWPLALGDEAAVTRLGRVIVAYVVYTSRHLDEVTVWLHDFQALPELRRAEIRQYEERHRRTLVELIAQGQLEGGIRADADPAIAALALFGAMNWVHRWFRPQGLSAGEIGERFGQIFLGGLSPRQPFSAR